MQDFNSYDYKIDLDGIIKAINDGQKISIIINGEYYDLIRNDSIEECFDDI